MERDHRETGHEGDYTTGSGKHAVAKGGGEGMRQSHARQEGERDRWKAGREEGTANNVCAFVPC